MIRLLVSLRTSLAVCVLSSVFLGLLAPATGLAAETQYSYDELGRLVLVTYPDGSAISYEYDANGNRTSSQHAQGGEVLISSFSPSSGQAGTSVNITGSGFSPTPALNTVRFGGVPAVVDSASATTLDVTVPLGAQTGPIVVEVGTRSATSTTDFTVLEPEITGFSPAFVNAGDPVSVTGTNLNLDPGSTSFSVVGSPANIVSLSNDDAVVEAPNVSGQIVVDTSYGQGTSSDVLTVVPPWINSENVAGLSTLALGASDSLSIAQVGGYAVFEFDAVADRWLAFRILSIATTPAGANVNYKLYSPSGAIVKSGWVSATGPLTIDLPPMAAGRYMMVFDSGNSTSLAVTALIELYPELDTGGAPFNYSGTVPGEKATYVFQANAGDDLSLGITDISVSTGSGAYVYVYRPNGAQWHYMTCYASWSPGCAKSMRNVPETGEYMVKVWPTSNSALASYTLTLTHYVDGGTLELDTPQPVAMPAPGQMAKFEFTATAGQAVALNLGSITTTPSNKYVNLRVYTASGSHVASAGNTSSTTLNLQDLAAGTYTVLVEPTYAVTTSATLELATGLAGTLPADGSSQTFATTVAGQQGHFTFTANAGDDLTLGITDLSVSTGSGAYIYVYRPSGSQWQTMTCYASWNPGCSKGMRNAPETGEYTVKVWPTSSSALASYTLTLSHYVDGGTLALDTPQPVAMPAPGQMAKFDFTATAGQTVALNLGSISTTPANKYVNLRVYTASGSHLMSAGNTSSATLNLPDLAAGTYTVLVEPTYAAPTSATLELATGLIGTLPTDGSSQSFSTTVAGQQGHFTFTANAGDDLSLGLTDLAVSTGSGAYVYVYRPNGSRWQTLTCYMSWSPGCSKSLRNAPETGEYTVKVWPTSNSAQASYTLNLSHYVDGGALVPDTPQTVAMTVPGQMAKFEFTATAGQTVALNMSSISTTPSNKYVNLRVYNASGGHVGSTGSTTSTTLNLQNLAAGTYTVRVEPTYAATASVQVELQEP
ncbi:MAG: IPT/TIG domain-containing protein [Woeseiaceae bacterium]|nr:IPT/TIG domain-containing protein [Woeseiaceae bacterium]